MTVAVIGGGPAGLMAAEVISAAGLSVIVFDRMPTVGRKLLMAGRGGLNLTHVEPFDVFMARYGGARDWLAPIIGAFPPEGLVAWVNDLGQETFVGSSGRIFPRAMKASPLLRAWTARLGARGVTFATGHRWTGFAAGGHVTFDTPKGPSSFEPSATVLALGGASWPRLGSDGLWPPLLTAHRVAVAPLVAANCGLSVPWSAHVVSCFAGSPLKRIAMTLDGHRVRGEAMVTAGGLEGGAVYGIVPDARRLLGDVDRVSFFIDLRPDETAESLASRLVRPRGKQSMSTFLSRTLDLAPVARALLFETTRPALPADPVALAHLIKGVPLVTTGLAGLDRAISTAGGVDTRETDSNLMLRRLPGVFVAGEMLDWEAPTGGYLLQAAFATGHVAGRGVVRYLAR